MRWRQDFFAMSKIIATAHIALAISAAVLLDVRYVQAMEFRACMNQMI
jgi:hypothetical protein